MTAVQHDYWEPEGFPAGCQQGTQSKSRGSFIVSCLVLEAFFQKAFQTQSADLFDITPNMLLLSLALTMSALHPLPVHPTGIKIRGYLWQAPHSNPSFMPENIRRSCSWLIEYSTIIPSRSAALSLPCVCVGLWYGTQGRDEAAVCWRGQWCWLTPLKTILKGFWWHIAVGPTAAYHMYFTRNDRTLTAFSFGPCGEDMAAVCLQTLVLSLGVTRSATENLLIELQTWLSHGNEKGKFISCMYETVSSRFCWVLKTMSPVQSWLCRLLNEERK